MADKLVSAARFAGGESVQAFPVGARVAVVAISGTNPTTLVGKVSAKSSLLTLAIPAGRTLYVGNLAQIADAADAVARRALMFPVPGPALWTVTLVDEDEPVAAFLGDADFDLPILPAATLGAE